MILALFLPIFAAVTNRATVEVGSVEIVRRQVNRRVRRGVSPDRVEGGRALSE
jgi:hypothetical protein